MKNIPPNAPITWFAPDGTAFTHQEHLEAQERACADDRQWFEAHPGVQVRLRPLVPGEMPGWGRGPAIVKVVQVQPGVRIRGRLEDAN